jgi:hypothetical protein
MGSQAQVTGATLSRPFGTQILATGVPPNTEVLGYFRVSLRDISRGRMFSRALLGSGWDACRRTPHLCRRGIPARLAKVRGRSPGGTLRPERGVSVVPPPTRSKERVAHSQGKLAPSHIQSRCKPVACVLSSCVPRVFLGCFSGALRILRWNLPQRYGRPGLGNARRTVGENYPQAIYQPVASRLLGGDSGVVFVFSSYSLGVLLVFSWCFARILRWELPQRHGVSIERVPEFDITGRAAIQTESRS